MSNNRLRVNFATVCMGLATKTKYNLKRKNKENCTEINESKNSALYFKTKSRVQNFDIEL